MTTPTREEIDAKLDTKSARMEASVASIREIIAGFTGRMDERFGRMDERMQNSEASALRIQQSISDLKSTMVVTAIATVLSIVFGVAAFNATVLSNMVTAFESGKSTATAQAEVKKQAEDTAALLRQIQQGIDESKKK